MAKNGVKTAERAAFIEWWFTVGRSPRTMTDWGRENNVAIQTLSEWKRSPEFIARQDTYRTLFRPDFVEATITMLGRAKGGDVSAYRAVADVLGENAPQKLEVSGKQGLLEWLGSTQEVVQAPTKPKRAN